MIFIINQLTFEQSIQNFLNVRATDEKTKNSNVTYSRKLQVFREYLQVIKGVNEKNYGIILRGLQNENILESVDYYVRSANVSFSTTIDSYIEAIIAYLKYLNNNSKTEIEVPFIDSENNELQLRKLVEDKIKELELLTKKVTYPLSDTEVEEVIFTCDKYISQYKFEQTNIGRKKNNPTDIFISAIITKLVCLTGIKNSRIYSLKLSAIIHPDIQCRLRLGNYEFNLPSDYIEQLQKYLKLRNILDSNNNCEHLFINRNGEPIKSNTYAFKVLNIELKHHKVTALSMAIIKKYLREKHDVTTVRNFTGMGIESCLYCQEILNEELKFTEDKQKNNYISLNTWQ